MPDRSVVRRVCTGMCRPSAVGLMALETEAQGCMDAAKGPAALLKEYHADLYLTTAEKSPEALRHNASGAFL